MNERDAKAAAWDGKDRRLAAGDGLYLLVRKSSKTWLYRRRHLGRETFTTIGKFPGISAKQARAKALNLALQDAPDTMAVEYLAGKYLDEVVLQSVKHPETVQGYIERGVIPLLGDHRVVHVTPAQIAAAVQEYSKRGARTGDTFRNHLRALFAYAVELGIRADNPAANVSRRVTGYKPAPKDRVLAPDEIRLLWSTEHPEAAMLRFLLATGLRTVEARKGHGHGDRWVVPEHVSKNGRTHWVYLSELVEEQAALMRQDIGPTHLAVWTRRFNRAHEIEPNFTAHDCRRTAATIMADNGVEPFIVERVLNHTMPGVMAVYNRAEYEKERIEAGKVLEAAIRQVVSK
jgi:integrase